MPWAGCAKENSDWPACKLKKWTDRKDTFLDLRQEERQPNFTFSAVVGRTKKKFDVTPCAHGGTKQKIQDTNSSIAVFSDGLGLAEMMIWCLFVVSLLVLVSAEEDAGGIFTSNSDLQTLLWTEAELIKGMRNYIEAEESKIAQLKE